MRIDSISQVAEMYNSQKLSGGRETGKMTASRDCLSISRTGYDYQVAKQAVAETSDIREDKVSQLKSQIASGSYSVEAGDFAGKLLEQYNKINNK